MEIIETIWNNTKNSSDGDNLRSLETLLMSSYFLQQKKNSSVFYNISKKSFRYFYKNIRRISLFNFTATRFREYINSKCIVRIIALVSKRNTVRPRLRKKQILSLYSLFKWSILPPASYFFVPDLGHSRREVLEQHIGC